MKTKILIITTSFVLFISACTTHTHIVGNGAQGISEVSKRQLWVFSLVPINDVDTHKMAGGATDYEIQTQVDFIDAIVSGFTSGIVTSRSVIVKK